MDQKMAKYGEDDVNVLHPSLRSIFSKPEKSLGLDKDKLTIEVLRDVFRKNCINLMPQFAQSGKPKLTTKQLILAYHLARGTVKGTAGEIKELMETSPYFDFEPDYMLPILRPVKSNMEYHKRFRGFRMLAVVYTPEEGFNISKFFDWSFSFTFTVEYVLRRHKISKTYEDFVKLNQELELELLSIPDFPEGKNLDQKSLGLELQSYIHRLHHSLAERGVFSPRLMTFLGIDYERVQSEEEGAFVLALDSPGLIPNTAWHFIDEIWLEKWRIYVRGRPPRRYYPPGPITNDNIYLQWKAYDDALQAAQRAEEEEHHIQEQETNHKVSFAARVLRLTKETYKNVAENTTDSNNHGASSIEYRGQRKHLGDLLAKDDIEQKKIEQLQRRKKEADDLNHGENGEGSDSNDGSNDNSAMSSFGSAGTNDSDSDYSSDDDRSHTQNGSENNNRNNDTDREEHDDDDVDDHLSPNYRKPTVHVSTSSPNPSFNPDKRSTLHNNNSAKHNASSASHKFPQQAKHQDHALKKLQRQERKKLSSFKKKQANQKNKTYVELPAKLEVIKDYRVINYNVWRFLQLVHGGGPVLSRELPDIYTKRAFSFLHAVIVIQTRIRMKLDRLKLQRLQLRKLSQSYAGKMLLVQEATSRIAARAQRQLVEQRQARITKHLDIAASFTQNLWRLKKHYYNEEALVAKQKIQESFAHVHHLQREVALSNDNESGSSQVVLDRKPIISIGNTNVYTVRFADNDGALPFTLQRQIGTQQAMVATSKDESKIVLDSILLTINGKPTNTMNYEEIKQYVSHASFPLVLEFMKPYDIRLLPTLFTIVDMKLQGAGKFAIYNAMKIALVRGIRLIKHNVHGAGMVCTSHRTILKINSYELMYQSHFVKPFDKYKDFTSSANATNNKVQTYDPEKEWVRFSLFDIKFIRDGRESEIIQSRNHSPLHVLSGTNVHASRCFEIVLENNHMLAFEFPSLKEEEVYVQQLLAMVDARIQEIDAMKERLENATGNSSKTHNSSSNGKKKGKANAQPHKNTTMTANKNTMTNNSSTKQSSEAPAIRPGLARSLTIQLRTLDEEKRQQLREESAATDSSSNPHNQGSDNNDDSDDPENHSDNTSDGESDGDNDDNIFYPSSGDENKVGAKATKNKSTSSKASAATSSNNVRSNNNSKNSNSADRSATLAKQAQEQEELVAELYVNKRQLLAEKHMLERELVDMERMRTYLTALRVKPISLAQSPSYTAAADNNTAAMNSTRKLSTTTADGASHTSYDLFQRGLVAATEDVKRGGEQQADNVGEDEEDSLHYRLWNTFVETSNHANSSNLQQLKSLTKKQQQQLLAEQQNHKDNLSATAAAAAAAANVKVDVDDDNGDLDMQDRQLCLKFQKNPHQNDAFLYKRIVMRNLKRLVDEIRGTQVFVSKEGVPIRRRQQKTALKRIGQDH